MAEELIIKVKTDGTAQVVGDLNKLGNGVGETAAKTKTASEVMKGAFGAIASSFLVLKGLEFGKSMISSMMSANAFLESSVTQLKVLTKSAASAKAMLVDLKKFADVTPFETADIVQAGKLMTTFGLNYKALLREAGDMAAAFSSNSGEMKQNLLEIISAMGRIKAGQMGESMEILRRFGVGRDTLEQMGLKFDKGGQYLGDAETFLRALRNLIHKNYSGMMDQMSKTWEGTMSNLRAHFENAAQMVGKEFFDKMKVEGQGLLQWLDKMRDSGQLEEWATRTGKSMTVLAESLVSVGKGMNNIWEFSKWFGGWLFASTKETGRRFRGEGPGPVSELAENITSPQIERIRRQIKETDDPALRRRAELRLERLIREQISNLGRFAAGGLSSISGGMLAAETAEKWNKLIDDATAAGIKIRVNSAYRTYAEQAALYAKYGPGRAAKPGTSAHEVGRAIDFDVISGSRSAFLVMAAARGFKQTVTNEGWHLEDVSGTGAESLFTSGRDPGKGKAATTAKIKALNYGNLIRKYLLSAREAVDEAAKTQEEAVKAWQEHMEQYYHFGTYSEMYGANSVQISTEEMRRRWRQIDEARASAPFIRREIESPAELLKPGAKIGEEDRYFEGYLDSYRQFLDDLMQQSGNFNDFMKDTWGNIRRYIADTFAFQAFKPLAQMLSEETSGIFGNMLGGEQKTKESRKEVGKEAGKEIAKGFDLTGIFGKAGGPGGILSSLFTAGIGGLISGALGAIFGSNPSYNPPPEVQPWESNEMLRLRSAEGTASYDVQPYLDVMREWTSRLDMLASSRNPTTDLLNQLLAQTPTVPSSTGFTLPASAFSSPTGIQLSQIMQGASSSSVSSATNAYYQELIGQGQTILEDALADMAPRDWMADAIANTRTIIQEFAVKFKEGNETARNIWDYFLEQFSEVINQGGGITQLSVTNPFTGAVTRATINPDGSISTGSTTGGTSTGTPINGNEVDIGLFTGETAGTSISNLTGSSAMSALQVEALIGIQEKLATGLTFDADFITALQKDTWNVNIQRIDPQIMSRFMAAAYSAGGPTGGATGGTTGESMGGTPTGAGATTGGTTGAGMPQFSAIGANSPFLYNGVYYYYSTDGSLNGNWPTQNAAQAAIQAYSTSSIASYVSGISSTVASNGIMNGVQFIGGLEAQNNALSGLAEAYAAAGITNPYTTQVSGIEGLAKGISGGNSGSQISVSITGPIQINPNSTGSIDKAILSSLSNYSGTQLVGAVVI